MHVDIAIDPAVDLWVGNNWQIYRAALEHVDEAQTPRVSSLLNRKGYQHSIRRDLKVGAQ